MPNKDGKGPAGKGPMTGRGSGHCAIPLNTTYEELSFLKDQKRVLKEQLHSIETRLKILETTTNRRER
jgi:hypothetical protein